MHDEDKERAELRTTIKRVYDEIQRRGKKPRRDPPKPLSREISRLKDREQFIKLCQERPNEVKAWIAELKDAVSHATEYPAPGFSFPIIYASYVNALAWVQGEDEVVLRKAWLDKDKAVVGEIVRRLLDCGTFDDSVMRLAQRRSASKPRRDALQAHIVEIVKEDPAITAPGLLARLRREVRSGHVVEGVHDESIEWTDGKGKVRDTPTHAVKDRLSRAKKALGLTRMKSR